MKWWVIGKYKLDFQANSVAICDLSFSRICINISGDRASNLLNHFLPLDLRESHFSFGSSASSAIHHVGVTLWKKESGYDVFVPRSFAVSIWELLFETSLQYGCIVK